MAGAAAEKAALRRRLRQVRKDLPAAVRRRAEQQAARYLKKLIKRGKRIAVYWPAGSELRLDEFVRAARARRARLYLPYIEAGRRRLWFTPYPAAGQGAERRVRRRPDIPQFGGRRIRAHLLHVLLLPLVGIDRCGIRLGQGGGCYDATLAACRSLKPYTVGVGFACQTVARLPAAPHDRRVDAFVCEQGRQRFHPVPPEAAV